MFTSPYPRNAAAVTPSDTTEQYGTAIYVGGAGNVTVLTEGGQTVTFTAPPVGSFLWIKFTKVMVATTATLLLRLYP
jgi:hypothetical protein